MDRSGKVVSLRLTADAAGTLHEILQDKRLLQALVRDSDSAGLWILLGEAVGEGES